MARLASCTQRRSTEHSMAMGDLSIRRGGPIKKEDCCICFCHYAQVHHQILQGIVRTSLMSPRTSLSELMRCYRSKKRIQLAKHAVM